MYGKPEFDSEGKPVCEICGLAFARVCAHVRQAHGLSAREYKQEFGFDVKKGICSRESREIARQRFFEHPEVMDNLLEAGKAHRFKSGHQGRTKDMVSEQTRRMLSERGKLTVPNSPRSRASGRQNLANYNSTKSKKLQN